MTLLEVTISLVVLAVGVGATMAAISSYVVLGSSTHETTVAYVEAQRMLEELKAADFEEVFRSYNTDPTDDPGAWGSAVGASFAVEGLTPRKGAGGAVGSIIFPVDEAAPSALREDLVKGQLGYEVDLNGDGQIDSSSHSDDYAALPVRIRVEWTSASGNRSVELQTLLLKP